MHVYYLKERKDMSKDSGRTGPVSGNLQIKITKIIDINNFFIHHINCSHIIHYVVEKQ